MSNTASVFIEDAPTVVRENPYAPLVAQLAGAGEGKVARLVFDDEKGAKNALSRFQAAAIDAGMSARKVGDIEETDGKWNLRVKLGNRRVRRTKEQVAADEAAKAAAKAAQEAAAASKPSK